MQLRHCPLRATVGLTTLPTPRRTTGTASTFCGCLSAFPSSWVSHRGRSASMQTCHKHNRDITALRLLLFTFLMSSRLHVVTLVHLLSQIRPETDFLSARVTLCAQHPVCACRTTRPTVHVANWLAAIHDGESYSSIYLLLPLPCPPPNSGQALLERTTTYTFPVFVSLFEKPFS